MTNSHLARVTGRSGCTRADIQATQTCQLVEPALGVGLKGSREVGQRQHIERPLARRWRQLLRWPAGDRAGGPVPGIDRSLPGIPRMRMKAVLEQGPAETFDHGLIDVCRGDALGRAPAHQPRQHCPGIAVGQAGIQGCPRRSQRMQSSPRHDLAAGALHRPQQQATDIGPTCRCHACRRWQGFLLQAIEQGGSAGSSCGKRPSTRQKVRTAEIISPRRFCSDAAP